MNERGNVQKACPRGGGESVQQDCSLFDARSVLSVREHGTMARTPLAAFFNIPIRDLQNSTTIQDIVEHRSGGNSNQDRRRLRICDKITLISRIPSSGHI